jgi:hypothetical protein
VGLHLAHPTPTYILKAIAAAAKTGSIGQHIRINTENFLKKKFFSITSFADCQYF